MRFVEGCLLGFALMAVCACESQTNAGPSGTESTDTPLIEDLSAAPVADVEVGPAPGDGEVPMVSMEEPESGFQLHSYGRWIEPGTDVEYCEVVVLPGGPDDVYYVNKLEVAMHPWSHHVIIEAASPGSEAEANMEDGMSVPCIRGEDAYGKGLVDVIGAQSPYNQLQLPEGVGRIYYGGQRVVVDYHYFNPTPDPIPARHAINFHRVEEQDVQHVAQTWGFYNFLVFALPGQEAQTAAACTFNDDVVLHSLTRHTHRWGTDFHIWHEGGEKDGQHLWSSESWETEVDYVFEEPLFVPAGEGFSFQCEYDNTTDSVLTFGIKATNEMCILFGVAWSPHGLTLPPQSCDAASVATTDMSGL